MALPLLPPDVWVHISDFAEVASLSCTCAGLNVLLKDRHVHYTSGSSAPKALLPPTLEAPHTTERVHTLTLRLQRLPVGNAGAARLVACAVALPQLHALALGLSHAGLGPPGACALAGLRDCKRLQRLQLQLWGNTIGDEGAVALAALRELDVLHTLELDLSGNGLGSAAARALAELTGAPGLKALTLDLWRNGVGDGGAQALAALHVCGCGAVTRQLVSVSAPTIGR